MGGSELGVAVKNVPAKKTIDCDDREKKVL